MGFVQRPPTLIIMHVMPIYELFWMGSCCIDRQLLCTSMSAIAFHTTEYEHVTAG